LARKSSQRRDPMRRGSAESVHSASKPASNWLALETRTAMADAARPAPAALREGTVRQQMVWQPTVPLALAHRWTRLSPWDVSVVVPEFLGWAGRFQPQSSAEPLRRPRPLVDQLASRRAWLHCCADHCRGCLRACLRYSVALLSEEARHRFDRRQRQHRLSHRSVHSSLGFLPLPLRHFARHWTLRTRLDAPEHPGPGRYCAVAVCCPRRLFCSRRVRRQWPSLLARPPSCSSGVLRAPRDRLLAVRRGFAVTPW
jgi:hypothetical protein